MAHIVIDALAKHWCGSRICWTKLYRFWIIIGLYGFHVHLLRRCITTECKTTLRVNFRREIWLKKWHRCYWDALVAIKCTATETWGCFILNSNALSKFRCLFNESCWRRPRHRLLQQRQRYQVVRLVFSFVHSAPLPSFRCLKGYCSSVKYIHHSKQKNIHLSNVVISPKYQCLN